MDQTYKIWIINAENTIDNINKVPIKKVIVFNGENMDMFSEDELALIENKENVVFSPVSIHKDDSIEQVKKKIINELGCMLTPHVSQGCDPFLSPNYDEIYLFAYKTFAINLLSALTSSTKSVIYKNTFNQFVKNMDMDEHTTLNREVYEYKFLASLGFNEEQVLSIKTGLGMEFKYGYNYLFSPNPFLNDPTVENEKIKESIYLNENKLLGQIDNNNIYVCLAKDVFEYAEKNNFSTELYSNIYFPNLASNQILGLEDLENTQDELKEKTDAYMNEEEFASYQIIDTLYEVYQPLANEKYGINHFNIEIAPSYKLVMPLDAIFKNIHCDMDYPFIKYNPGVRRENIYRLYSTSVSKTGKKIPYLSKKKIESLMRTTSNHKQISIYNSTHQFIISIEADGCVKMNGSFKEDAVKTIKEIEEMIKLSVNPLIKKINSYLINSGYRIATVNSLKDEKIKIVNMNYQYSVILSKNFIEIKSNNNAFILNGTKYQVREGIYSVKTFIEELKKQMVGFDITYDDETERFTIIHGNSEFTIDAKKSTIKNVMGFGKNEILESNQFILELPNPVLKIANMNLKNTCIYPVFWVEKNNVKKEAVLRFVRVDNFQKMKSLDAFIHDMYNKRENVKDAYNALVVQQGFELEKAKKQVFKVLKDTNNVSKNPGLVTTMKLDGDVLKVSVNNLNNIEYVETLGIYLNSIVNITQEMVDVSDVCDIKEEKQMGKQEEEEEEEIQDVRKEVEQLLGKNEKQKKEEDSDSSENFFHESDYESGSESSGGDSSSTGGEGDSDSDSTGGEGDSDSESSGGDSDSEGNYFHDSDYESDSDKSSENYFRDSDYESDSGSNSSSGGDSGSDNSDDETVKGKKYFLNRLTKKDPVLFKEVNKTNGKIGRYTRTCPSMQQPVVISNKEKEHIDKHYKDSYNKETAIEYGSSGDKKNWYICPQFWCFKTNTPMTQQDIDAGKCGDVKERKQNVFEFTDKKHKNLDGSYRNFNPGFIVNHHTNKDLCLPCCYAEWDSKMHKERRDKCLNVKPDEVKSVDKKKPVQTTEIMGHNSTLTPGRWGYIPVSVRRFMQIKYKEDDLFQFLRYGVEKNDKQSLVACLADIYGKMNKRPVPTISEMRKILVDSISLDDYKKYGKGSFVRLFSKNPKSKASMLSESFDNFRKYLRDENSNIDHTYLWDVISTPNKKLFENGLNLVIMEIVNNDITDKVDIICPLSSYVQNRFIKERNTIFLMNLGNRYEPIYLVDKSQKLKHSKTYFSLTTTEKIPNMHNLLKTLDKTLNEKCKTSRIGVNNYTFKYPMEAEELIHQINETNGYSVEKQVLNYQERTIALWVKTPSNHHIVVPCEPSEQQNYPAEYMDEASLWSNYKTTLEELMRLKKANDKILCKPVVKMLEDGLVVGFLTETNQFIKFNNPGAIEEDAIEEDANEEDAIEEDGLPQQNLSNSKQNPYEIEMAIDNSTSEDPERIRIVRNINLESSFFALYRATIKSLLEDIENRQQVVSIIENAESLYKEKLENVKQIIDEITSEVVVYTKMSESTLTGLSEISYTCKNTETSGLYINGCHLAIPEKNLVSKKNNSVIYAYRVADEIVRYGRIQNYILNSNQFLNTGNTDFKINTNEFIITETGLSSKDYFDDMINQNTNEYRKFNETNGIPYDMAKTKIHLPILVEKEKEKKPEIKTKTEIPEIDKYYKSSNGKNFWAGKVFPRKHLTDKITFKNTERSSFGPLLHIMKEKEYSVNELKEELWNAYSSYLPTYKDKIIDLLKHQGKRKILKKYNNDLNLLIASEDYFLTLLDVWVFAQKYNVPIILFSSTNIINDIRIVQGENPSIENKEYLVDETAMNKNPEFNYAWIVLGGGEEDKFFFYLSSSKNKSAHDINRNEIIAEPLHKTQMGEFQQQLEYVFEQNRVFSVEDYLKRYTL